jgi:hypothetical protein
MSEEITTPSTDEATTNEAAQEPQGSPETDWKAEARKWEARAKADHDAANQWREFESSQKSEYEKLADQLAQTKAEASEASTKLLKFEVATQKGIPAEALDLLNGSTREELERAADKLLSLIADQSKPNTPKPDLNQGKPSSGGASTGDQFAAALASLL